MKKLGLVFLMALLLTALCTTAFAHGHSRYWERSSSAAFTTVFCTGGHGSQDIDGDGVCDNCEIPPSRHHGCSHHSHCIR